MQRQGKNDFVVWVGHTSISDGGTAEMAKPTLDEKFGLSGRKRKFLELYFAGGKTQARCYKEAGFGPKNDAVGTALASRLLKNASSRKYLRHLQQQAHESLVNECLSKSEAIVNALKA